MKTTCHVCGSEMELDESWSPPFGAMYIIACDACIEINRIRLKAEEDARNALPKPPPEPDYWHK